MVQHRASNFLLFRSCCFNIFEDRLVHHRVRPGRQNGLLLLVMSWTVDEWIDRCRISEVAGPRRIINWCCEFEAGHKRKALIFYRFNSIRCKILPWQLLCKILRIKEQQNLIPNIELIILKIIFFFTRYKYKRCWAQLYHSSPAADSSSCSLEIKKNNS